MLNTNHDFNMLQPGTYLEKEGGYYVGQLNYPDGTLCALILAPQESEVKLPWKTENSYSLGTNCEYNGYRNSYNMSNREHPAANYCRNYRGGNKDDWYMAAKKEWQLIQKLNPSFLKGKWYLSSSEYSDHHAVVTNRITGVQTHDNKNTKGWVIPVRRVQIAYSKLEYPLS